MLTMTSSDSLAGFFGALGAPLLMVIGLTLWDGLWPTDRRFMLNLFKGWIGALYFGVAVLLTQSLPRPAAAGDETLGWTIFWLVIGSILGIVIGDTFWLEAQSRLGTARTCLFDALKPFASAAFAQFMLGEETSFFFWVGMAITSVSVIFVARSSKENKDNGDTGDGHAGSAATAAGRELSSGYGFAVLNVMFDSFASVLTKQHARGLTSWEIGLVRFGSAGVLLLVWSQCTSGSRLRGLLAAAWGCGGGGSTTRRFREMAEAPDANPPAEAQERAVPAAQLELGAVTEAHGGSGGGSSSSSSGGGGSSREPGRPWYDPDGRWTIQLSDPGSLCAWTCKCCTTPCCCCSCTTCRAWFILCGAIFLTTFLCPALGTWALFQINVGLHATLSACAAVFGLMTDRFIPPCLGRPGKEVTWQALGGAIGAVVGVAVLFWAHN